MHFQVLNTATSKFVGNENGPYRYLDGTEAAEAARIMTAHTGQKHQPRRIADDVDWRARERARFEDGTYLRVPWIDKWWFRHHNGNPDHFVHLSTDKPGFVAFTPDEEKGIADRQTRMRGGAYLKKFFSDHLTHEEITRLATELAGELEANEVKFATTPDEIEEVYTNGPSSCMSHDASYYDSSIHPVRVYGAGDLAIAYLKRNDRVTARSVVWPDKKVYTSIYGDAVRLKPLLTNLGYKKGDIDGARLLKIKESDGYVCPYVDAADYVDVGDKYLILRKSDGQFSTGSTNGYIGTPPARCEHCDNAVGEDDLCSVYFGRHNSGLWCENCRDNDAIWCEDEGISVVNDQVVQMADGDYWSTWKFDRDGAICKHTGNNYSADEMHVVHLRDSTTENWCEDACQQDAVQCAITQGWYARDAAVTLKDGRVVGYDTEAGEQAIADGEAELGSHPHVPSPTVNDPNQLSLLEAAE